MSADLQRTPAPITERTRGAPRDLRCPECGRDDAVQKVSAIHSAGIQHSSSTTSGLIAGGIGHPLSGGDSLLAGTLSATRGSAQSGLSAKLRPPDAPRKPSSLDSLVIGLTVGAAAGFAIAIVAFPKAGLSVLALLFITLFGMLGAGMSWSLGNASNENERLRALPQWERQMTEWNKLYYCARDDAVFDPATGTAAAAVEIMGLVKALSGAGRKHGAPGGGPAQGGDFAGKASAKGDIVVEKWWN